MALKILAGLVLAIVLVVIMARKTQSTVYIERTLNASVDQVWKIWNDPESMKNWWSPKDFTAPVIKNDFRVGGTFLLSMKSPKGEMFWNTGTYQEIIPHQKIVSSMAFSDETGRVIPGSEVKVPGEWPDQITVTVEFKETNGKTTIAITEVGIPLIMKVLAKMGWEQQLDKFEKLL